MTVTTLIRLHDTGFAARRQCGADALTCPAGQRPDGRPLFLPTPQHASTIPRRPLAARIPCARVAGAWHEMAEMWREITDAGYRFGLPGSGRTVVLTGIPSSRHEGTNDHQRTPRFWCARCGTGQCGWALAGRDPPARGELAPGSTATSCTRRIARSIAGMPAE